MGALNMIQLPSLHLATFSSFISPSFSQSPLKTLTPTRRSITRTSSLKSFLDLTPEYKPQSLNIDLERHDFTGGSPDYDAVIIGCGPSGLHLASLASKHGLHICCVDPSPLLLWPNNYGVWVDEFEAMNLTDTLDKVWPSATVIINDQKSKHLDRPYGRVNRNYLKSKLIQACVSNGVKFHVAKAWKVEHQVSRPSPRAGPADRPAASNGAGPHWVQGLRLDLVRVNTEEFKYSVYDKRHDDSQKTPDPKLSLLLIGDFLVSKLVILVQGVRVGNGGDLGTGKEG